MRKVVGSRFIIISGNLSFRTVQDFLAEFYHPTHDKGLSGAMHQYASMTPSIHYLCILAAIIISSISQFGRLCLRVRGTFSCHLYLQGRGEEFLEFLSCSMSAHRNLISGGILGKKQTCQHFPYGWSSWLLSNLREYSKLQTLDNELFGILQFENGSICRKYRSAPFTPITRAH